jgi:hypothetical protein
MLVDRVLRDLDIPDPDELTGNAIRGSRLGRCARQSAYMMFPKAYPPEPLPARAKLVFKFGDMIHDLVRAEFRRVTPGLFGYEEGRFHFKVPLSVKEASWAMALIEHGALRGQVVTDAPTVRAGLVLDIATPALWVPLHVDGIADLGDIGLASVEIKSMAHASFRRAVKGHVDYAYRVQMAAAVDATDLDAQMYVAINKNTCHALEVVYTKKATEVTVTFTKQPHTSMVMGLAVEDGGDWEAAEVRHPFEPHLLEQARDRVRRVLRATVTSLPEREYGPSFVCWVCQGTGTQTKAKNTGLPLKKAKPCEECERSDVPVAISIGDTDLKTILGVGAPTGRLAVSELPFQCRYCPFVTPHCWPMAKLEIEDERPHFRISRADYDASGITFKGPE